VPFKFVFPFETNGCFSACFTEEGEELGDDELFDDVDNGKGGEFVCDEFENLVAVVILLLLLLFGGVLLLLCNPLPMLPLIG
jgi:hypothetical protein